MTIKFLSLAVVAAFLCYVTSCNNTSDPTLVEPKPTPVILKGTVKNVKKDHLTLMSKQDYREYQLALHQDSLFQDTLYLSEGYYRLNGVALYLKPGFDLALTMNMEADDNALSFAGIGAVENNYLVAKARFVADFEEKRDYFYYIKLDEKEFVALMDSLYQIQVDFLQQTPDLDEHFFFLEKKFFEFERLNMLANFEFEKQLLSEDNISQVSDAYPDAFEQIDLVDERLLLVGNYKNFVYAYIDKKAQKRLAELKAKDPMVDRILNFVEITEEEIASRPLRESLYHRVGTFDINYSRQIDSVYAIIKPSLKNELFLEEVNECYEVLSKTRKGAVSPSFSFEGLDGNMYRLEDFKGKLVYIDIWGSWCQPCLAELPSLKVLEENLRGQDIVFVSIDVNDPKEVWKKTIQEKEMSGVHLYASDFDNAFFNDYRVQGFPRFILLDKEGKVLDRNARRPSDPTLRAEIEQYL